MDRVQSYNPTSGDYYDISVQVCRKKIKDLINLTPPPLTFLEPLRGEWELVLSTFPRGIFRSSPFFLAVQEAFTYAENTAAFDQDKANLFFKLHELQVMSWGVSKVGRVAQRFTVDYIYSEFDTSIFSLTAVPFLRDFASTSYRTDVIGGNLIPYLVKLQKATF